MPASLESPRAYVTPSLLTWARDRAGLSFTEAAKRMGITEAKWVEWERGNSRPTFRQAENLARKLYVPFGFLFLSTPPALDLELPDLRTVQGNPVANPSPEMEEVVIDALRKLEWYRDYRKVVEESAPLPFVGRFTVSSPITEVAADLDNTLGISSDIRPQANSWEDFLNRLINSAEQAGVLVLRNGVVGNNTHRPLNVKEFRGFAFSDEFAPLIFLNGQDARAAQIFTLVHELAHIWVNESGLSNPEYNLRARDHSNHIERFCDSVAAETLAPKKDFLAGWEREASTATNIQSLATHFKVSRIVVLRRAAELETIDRGEFQEQYSQLQSASGQVRRGGGDGRRNVLARNSPRFTKGLVESVLSGHTTEREAAGLLGMKVASFDKLVQWLTEVERD